MSCIVASALFAGACRDLDRFTTGDDEAYCGNVVTSSFVRSSGFVPSARMRLELDMEELTTVPGIVTLDNIDEETGTGLCAPDPTFQNEPLITTEQVFHDPLSSLDFGDGREHNILAWVTAECDVTLLAVVSLMKNDDVEVRLLSPSRPTSGDAGTSEFALFPLTRKRGRCGLP